eukprot:548769_1
MAVMRSVLRYIFLTIWCCYYCQSFHANPTVRVRSTMGTDVSSFGFQTSGDNLSKSIHVSTTHIASRLRIQIDRFIEIGTCDDLILDARSNYNLGGANDSHYRWYIHDMHQQYTGVFTVISNKDIISLPNTFMVELAIPHSHKINITVHKSNIIGKIELHAINQHDKMDIYSSIAFENHTVCNHITNGRRITVIEYVISWSVAFELQNASNVIEPNKLQRLRQYLISQSEMNADSLSIDMHRMVQPGADYHFTMDVVYTTNENHVHNSTATHTFIYKQPTDSVNVHYDHSETLFVSVRATPNRINAHDKLRILCDVANKDNDKYEHRWFEVDGLLTDADVLLHSQTNHNSLNLVLKSNTLKAGHVYHFRLEVLRYNQANVLTQHGISSIIKIYVNAAVPIMDHSLLLSPECPNGEITYDSINDYIDRMNQYRVSVVVDSSATNVPLLYEFSHIQANMLSTPFEDHVQLYIGNNTLRAHVYDDALSVVTTASVQCRVMVTDDTQCID